VREATPAGISKTVFRLQIRDILQRQMPDEALEVSTCKAIFLIFGGAETNRQKMAADGACSHTPIPTGWGRVSVAWLNMVRFLWLC
jgi:hypothetical protein